MKELFTTNVGSHMWGMERPGSDLDLFVCYQAPSKDFLVGSSHANSHFSQVDGVDRASHELGVVVKQVLAGNVNHLWGTMSPIIVKDWEYLPSFQALIKLNLSKRCYHSLHGLSLHNYKKYIEERKESTEQYFKRCRLICRTLKFGTTLLSTGRFAFDAVGDCNRDDVLTWMNSLEVAYAESILPDAPQHEREMWDWLFGLRMLELKGA